MSLIFKFPAATEGSTLPQSQGHGIYIGGRAEAKNRPFLLRHRISYILNATPVPSSDIKGVSNFFEREAAVGGVRGRLQFRYRRVPVYDIPSSDIAEHFDAAVKFIREGSHHGSVLVHCQRGVSRSTSCVVAYLMRVAGMTFDDGLSLCRSRRPECNPIDAFVRQLKEYEAKCLKKGYIGKSLRTSCGGGAADAIHTSPAIGPAAGSGIGAATGSGIGPAVGPAISTSLESPVGPAIGPARGPTMQPSTSGNLVVQLRLPIGPARGGLTIGPSIGPSAGPSAVPPSIQVIEPRRGRETGNVPRMPPAKKVRVDGSSNA
eukprot:CAMPEP_0194286344 /NCGR_PEP_ID=MMETSP0169-20130528/32345_1 /TAXON_ID=218684 /ORGANISM="Corethron pennatum, Strain L29A3" /LENGTH=317 /DNA_ID=CAMNT_0039032749 /DNA_START=62 /DNA_END=1015 /DNA_ORIENTATION=-